jgi:uncharacterized membrane protein
MTTDSTAPVTTSDERTMAALAHFFGLIAALIVYVVNKDKSRFVRFQALQSLALDALWIVLSLGLTMCLTMGIFGGIAIGIVAAANEPRSSEAVAPILFGAVMPWLMFACIMPFSLLHWIARLIACISVATGHDFRYPLIGRQVDAFLKNG